MRSGSEQMRKEFNVLEFPAVKTVWCCFVETSLWNMLRRVHHTTCNAVNSLYCFYFLFSLFYFITFPDSEIEFFFRREAVKKKMTHQVLCVYSRNKMRSENTLHNIQSLTSRRFFINNPLFNSTLLLMLSLCVSVACMSRRLFGVWRMKIKFHLIVNILILFLAKRGKRIGGRFLSVCQLIDDKMKIEGRK